MELELFDERDFLLIAALTLCRFFSLAAGDVIITGTPPGVGCFRKPPIYLKVSSINDDN